MDVKTKVKEIAKNEGKVYLEYFQGDFELEDFGRWMLFKKLRNHEARLTQDGVVFKRLGNCMNYEIHAKLVDESDEKFVRVYWLNDH